MNREWKIDFHAAISNKIFYFKPEFNSPLCEFLARIHLKPITLLLQLHYICRHKYFHTSSFHRKTIYNPHLVCYKNRLCLQSVSCLYSPYALRMPHNCSKFAAESWRKDLKILFLLGIS